METPNPVGRAMAIVFYVLWQTRIVDARGVTWMALLDFDMEMLSPRYIAITTDPRWMTTYWQIEKQEEAFRNKCRLEQPVPLELWLRCLTLYAEAFDFFNEVHARAIQSEMEVWNR